MVYSIGTAAKSAMLLIPRKWSEKKFRHHSVSIPILSEETGKKLIVLVYAFLRSSAQLFLYPHSTSFGKGSSKVNGQLTYRYTLIIVR